MFPSVQLRKLASRFGDRVFSQTRHMRYAQRFNRQRGMKGHAWQGQYFSAPLDETYLGATLRFEERNPVRAGMVRKAEGFRWSRSAAHCRLREDTVLTSKERWWARVNEIVDWSSWLTEGNESEHLTVIRRNIEKGLPCGSDTFLKKLEKREGRMLKYRLQGRPKIQNKG